MALGWNVNDIFYQEGLKQSNNQVSKQLIETHLWLVCEHFDHFKDIYVGVLGEDSSLADMIKENDDPGQNSHQEDFILLIQTKLNTALKYSLAHLKYFRGNFSNI